MSTKLDDYLRREGITDAEFGVSISKDRTMVSKLRRGVLRPTLDVAAAIEAQTYGELPMQIWVDQVVHADDGSHDAAPSAFGKFGEVSDQVAS